MEKCLADQEEVLDSHKYYKKIGMFFVWFCNKIYEGCLMYFASYVIVCILVVTIRRKYEMSCLIFLCSHYWRWCTSVMETKCIEQLWYFLYLIHDRELSQKAKYLQFILEILKFSSLKIDYFTDICENTRHSFSKRNKTEFT